ncbi:hypothetical protein U0070_000146, partial [Myodes glareolus]
MAFIASLGNKGCCGGFLVKDNFVLTAAHCRGSSMKVTLGAHDIKIKEETQQIFPVTKCASFRGDAGGPLLREKAAAGIVSFGHIHNSTLRIFTRGSHFFSWIKEVTYTANCRA